MTAPGLYLALTAFVCGALVMAIEVLGARVIGPFFGASLFVWTALITVTLVALSAGYAVGGWLADRCGSTRMLYAVILAAGICAALVPVLKLPLLKACAPLGLRVGSLASATILFGPSLFLLGCVSPMLVKLALRDTARIGRTVGLLYALSTVGSVAGTVAAGFFLMAHFGIDRIFQIVGALLILLAVVHFVAFERRLAALVLLLVPLALPQSNAPSVKRAADGTVATLIHKHDGHYGSVRVIEYRHTGTHIRELVIDGLIQSGVDVASGLSIHEYSYLLSWLPWALRPDGGDALVIGLGFGVVPNWFAARGMRTEVVEIDPAVIEAARSWGRLHPGLDIHEADARRFLASTDRSYDYLLVDAFTGDSAPAHLLSAQAFSSMRARLAPGGVVAFNLHGPTALDSKMVRAVLRTLKSVFPEIRVYSVGVAKDRNRVDNIIVVAGERLAERPDLGFIAAEPVHRLARSAIDAGRRAPLPLPDLANALILTDDYNPIDFFDLELREAVRRIILESTDWDLLLG